MFFRRNVPSSLVIGDDDLLEILGQATNPTVIQTHLKKLFAGIHSVQFDEDCSHIMAMKSLEGEVVPLQCLLQSVLMLRCAYLHVYTCTYVRIYIYVCISIKKHI